MTHSWYNAALRRKKIAKAKYERQQLYIKQMNCSHEQTKKNADCRCGQCQPVCVECGALMKVAR